MTGAAPPRLRRRRACPPSLGRSPFCPAGDFAGGWRPVAADGQLHFGAGGQLLVAAAPTPAPAAQPPPPSRLQRHSPTKRNEMSSLHGGIQVNSSLMVLKFCEV